MSTSNRNTNPFSIPPGTGLTPPGPSSSDPDFNGPHTIDGHTRYLRPGETIAPLPPASKGHILMATPQALGMACVEFQVCWAATMFALQRAGYVVQPWVQDSSNICTSRNKAVGVVLNTPSITHLLYLDSDESWEPVDAILNMLALDLPIIGGCYVTRRENPYWTFRLGKGKELSDARPDPRTGVLEVEMLPTGFMLIQRGALELMALNYPERKCNFDSALPPAEPGHYLFFDQRLACMTARYRDDQTGEWINHYLTDDFGFCELWNNIGGRMYAYPYVTVHHYWRTKNSANLAHTLKAMGIPIPDNPQIP